MVLKDRSLPRDAMALRFPRPETSFSGRTKAGSRSFRRGDKPCGECDARLTERTRQPHVRLMSAPDFNGKEVAMERDPVCGTEVDRDNAPAKSNYQGRTFYFCSQ